VPAVFQNASCNFIWLAVIDETVDDPAIGNLSDEFFHETS